MTLGVNTIKINKNKKIKLNNLVHMGGLGRVYIPTSTDVACKKSIIMYVYWATAHET
jgi:hypothetical protein